jgi:hypothetical protein
MNIASNLIMYTGAYLYFCFLSIDPKRHATYWVGNPMFGLRWSRQDIDRSFKFFGAGALLWTAILFVLEKKTASTVPWYLPHCVRPRPYFLS